MLSHVRLSATPWTVACQAPLYMEFLRQEYWSRLPFPTPGNLPNPGIKPGSPVMQTDSLPLASPGKPYTYTHIHTYIYNTHICYIYIFLYIHIYTFPEFLFNKLSSLVSNHYFITLVDFKGKMLHN